jgi:hypothetical protein
LPALFQRQPLGGSPDHLSRVHRSKS